MTEAGEQLGPYRLIRRLGHGGMAETFEAVREGPGGFAQRVCLKRILPAFENDKAFVHMFLREARTSAALRHANIAQVIDFGVADGSHFLALELIDGADLRAILDAQARRAEDVEPPHPSRQTPLQASSSVDTDELQERSDPPRGALPASIVLLLAVELCTALEYAHKADEWGEATGIIHRDISPSNVLLSPAGEVKLTDFGIAKAAHATTRSGFIKGKVPYMAPEYATSGLFSIRSDLYALGVCLYESLAGRRPYLGKGNLEILRQSSTGDFPRLQELAPHAPVQLCQVIEKLLSPRPEDRYRDTSVILDDLAELPFRTQSRRELGMLVAENMAMRAPDVVASALPGAFAQTVSADADRALAATVAASPQAPAEQPDAVGAAAMKSAFMPTMTVSTPPRAQPDPALPSQQHGAAQQQGAAHAMPHSEVDLRERDGQAHEVREKESKPHQTVTVSSTMRGWTPEEEAKGATHKPSAGQPSAGQPSVGRPSSNGTADAELAKLEPNAHHRRPTKKHHAGWWLVGIAACAFLASAGTLLWMLSGTAGAPEKAGADTPSGIFSPGTGAQDAEDRDASEAGDGSGESDTQHAEGSRGEEPAIAPLPEDDDVLTVAEAFLGEGAQDEDGGREKDGGGHEGQDHQGEKGVAETDDTRPEGTPEDKNNGSVAERTAVAPAPDDEGEGEKPTRRSSSARGRASSRKESKGASEGTGTLKIVVEPLGNVWINGRKLGPSPQTVVIPAGSHSVAGGDIAPVQTKQVSIQAGERKTVTIR